MNSDVITQALLESAIDSLKLTLKKTTDEFERSRIQQKIEGLTKYLKELFPESQPVEISKAELDELFDKLEKRAYPGGRNPPG